MRLCSAGFEIVYHFLIKLIITFAGFAEPTRKTQIQFGYYIISVFFRDIYTLADSLIAVLYELYASFYNIRALEIVAIIAY